MLGKDRRSRGIVISGTLVALAVAAAALVLRPGGNAWDPETVTPDAITTKPADAVQQVAAQPPIVVTAERLERGRRDIAAAVMWSAEHRDFAVVVDKSAYTLLAYKDGVEAGSWPVELGPDPVRAKEREGDLRTPEGRYRVTWRRERGETTFYRALLLDYPNADDRQQDRTGGLIEIHGSGSGRRPGVGGSNWTLGCVALSNQDVDELLALADGSQRVAEGTPVTIVYAGTLRDERYHIVDQNP